MNTHFSNGLHHSTPWWAVFFYRVFVLSILAVTAYHQFSAHNSCVTLPVPPVG